MVEVKKKCRICGKEFTPERYRHVCPSCTNPYKNNRWKGKNKKPEKKPTEKVNRKQCSTCAYLAGESMRQSGIYCDYAEITGRAKILDFPGCKMPPNCDAYRRRTKEDERSVLQMRRKNRDMSFGVR